MRKKLLSYMVLSAAILAAGLVHHVIVSMDGDGTAQASLGAMGAPVGEMRSATRKSLATQISLNPAHMMNVRGQDIKSILREPELVRHDAPTTIWQYRTDACVLDIYFAGDSDPLLSPVAYYEIRARGKGVEDAKIAGTCVRDLARKSGRPRMVDVSTLYKNN
jgi:hypothetical protein